MRTDFVGFFPIGRVDSKFRLNILIFNDKRHFAHGLGNIGPELACGKDVKSLWVL